MALVLSCTKDASLYGIGWFYDGRFFHSTYSHFITEQSLRINALEMLTVTVSAKLWASVLPLQRILVLTDDKSTELALITLGNHVFLSHKLAYTNRYDFEISAHHIAGSQNVIADCSSRWDLNTSHQQQFYGTVLPLYGSITKEHCTPELFSFECPWLLSFRFLFFSLLPGLLINNYIRVVLCKKRLQKQLIIEK